MKALLLLFFILVGYTNLSAQDSTLVTIKAGYNVKNVLTSADIYYFPKFTNGKVYFRDGTKAIGDMNYNRLFDQMLFINAKGDTLALADEKTIKLIAIHQDTFYYNEGYMRLIADDGVIKLAEKQVWVIADVQKIGTHNRPTTTVAITSLSSYNDEGGRAKSYDFILNEDIVLRKETQYYFGDKYSFFVLANKKRLLQLFPNEEVRIEKYLNENKINFNKRADLERLYQFLSQLH